MVATAEMAQGDAEAASPRALRYIPALDGLRAVAVVGVMLFHGGVSWMPGGFLGVDVFFVLSGYLITTLLLRERVGTDRIDLWAFWVRRLRRLLPALLLLLAVVAVATPFLVDPVQRASLRGDGLAALAYVANWRFIFTEQSYFAGTPSPLRHLWSLAVEEQWYVFFPVVVAVALRRARRIRPLLIGLLVAAAASALWMAHLASGAMDPSRAYYGTDSRAHSLLVGAILAVVAAQWPIHRFRRSLAGAGVLGAIGVASAYLFVHESDMWMYQGGFLALAVVTAALVASIVLPRSDNPLARLLAVGPLVAIGRVSYGLYLWHWPVNLALTPRRVGLDGDEWWQQPALLALRTAVAVAFTLASYFLVEVPVRRRGLDGLRIRVPGLRRSRPAAVAMCAALVVWLLVAATLRIPAGKEMTFGQAGALPPALADLEEELPELLEEPPATVPVEIREAVDRDGIPAVPPDRPVRIMVLGDSVPWTLLGTPEHPPEIEVANAARLGCGLTPGLALVDGRIDRSARDCADWLHYWQVVALRSQPDVMVVHFGAWEVYDHKLGKEIIEFGTPEMKRLMWERFDEGFRAITAIKPDVRFLFVGMPCMQEENLMLGGSDSPRNDPERLEWINQIFEEYSDGLGDRSLYADMGELFCPEGTVRNEIDGRVVRHDGVHYEEGGAGPVWQWIADKVVPFARTPVAPVAGTAGTDPGAEEPGLGVAEGTSAPGPSGAGAGDPPA